MLERRWNGKLRGRLPGPTVPGTLWFALPWPLPPVLEEDGDRGIKATPSLIDTGVIRFTFQTPGSVS